MMTNGLHACMRLMKRMRASGSRPWMRRSKGLALIVAVALACTCHNNVPEGCASAACAGLPRRLLPGSPRVGTTAHHAGSAVTSAASAGAGSGKQMPSSPSASSSAAPYPLGAQQHAGSGGRSAAVGAGAMPVLGEHLVLSEIATIVVGGYE